MKKYISVFVIVMIVGFWSIKGFGSFNNYNDDNVIGELSLGNFNGLRSGNFDTYYAKGGVDYRLIENNYNHISFSPGYVGSDIELRFYSTVDQEENIIKLNYFAYDVVDGNDLYIFKDYHGGNIMTLRHYALKNMYEGMFVFGGNAVLYKIWVKNNY